MFVSTTHAIMTIVMDPLTQLYERLRAQQPAGAALMEPPSFEEWLKYWDDEQSDLVNLRTFEHWLARRVGA
jgi:hypothetical protein